MTDAVDELERALLAGEISSDQLERLSQALEATDRWPPRDKLSWHKLIRVFFRLYGPSGLSARATMAEVSSEFDRYLGGADWQRHRHLWVSPYADRRRTLMWRILRYGPLPAKSKLHEILHPNR